MEGNSLKIRTERKPLKNQTKRKNVWKIIWTYRTLYRQKAFRNLLNTRLLNDYFSVFLNNWLIIFTKAQESFNSIRILGWRIIFWTRKNFQGGPKQCFKRKNWTFWSDDFGWLTVPTKRCKYIYRVLSPRRICVAKDI